MVFQLTSKKGNFLFSKNLQLDSVNYCFCYKTYSIINYINRETFLLKIGLKKERWGDEELVEKLLDMMQHTGADFTATFRQLAEVKYFYLFSFGYFFIILIYKSTYNIHLAYTTTLLIQGNNL